MISHAIKHDNVNLLASVVKWPHKYNNSVSAMFDLAAQNCSKNCLYYLLVNVQRDYSHPLNMYYALNAIELNHVPMLKLCLNRISLFTEYEVITLLEKAWHLRYSLSREIQYEIHYKIPSKIDLSKVVYPPEFYTMRATWSERLERRKANCISVTVLVASCTDKSLIDRDVLPIICKFLMKDRIDKGWEHIR